jgi:hypothetical protein
MTALIVCLLSLSLPVVALLAYAAGRNHSRLLWLAKRLRRAEASVEERPAWGRLPGGPAR